MAPLPVRIVPSAPLSPCLSVDGAMDAPGLNLSHWPGNTTPSRFRHDLSTGSALLFAELSESERAEHLAPLHAIVNNHYDTDGTCALFAAAYPEPARRHATALLDAARAGDFFEVPTEDAFRVDCAIAGVADPDLSPIAEDLVGLDALGRWNRATAFWLEQLPELLSGDFAPYRQLWEAPLTALRSDASDLAQCDRSEDTKRETTRFTAPFGLHSSRDSARPTDCFDPGRHALFAATDADRVWVAGPTSSGTTYRFIISTRSWFDLAQPRSTPRPDIERWAEILNQHEGTTPDDRNAWRAQKLGGASPELWFGTAEHSLFAEHAECLRPSRLTNAPELALGAEEKG